MEWFKFYHNKWLSDRAIRSLTPQQQLCFITLLCVTSQSDERNGIVTYYDEREIIALTGLQRNPYDTEDCDVKRAQGFTEILLDRGVLERINENTIRVKNFEKRQQTQLSGAERAKAYRERKKSDDRNVTSRDDRNAREEKIREEKIREDKKEIVARVSFGEMKHVHLTEQEYQNLCTQITKERTDGLIVELDQYIASTGKIYKSHYATIQTWARRRQQERKPKHSFGVIG